MRPVELEMDGFGSYRRKATIDFGGVDYFALVGPTGAGKSTIIDALTFALYGCVVRWDDARAIEPALAPTVNLGKLRFVFDARGERYVAYRELRRSGTGKVAQKVARLERLVDRHAAAAPDDATEVVADGIDETKRAVEGLLGLTFDQFTKCVVLPQGQFAELLHAKPKDRDEILRGLLGLDGYTAIGQTATARATRLTGTADLLEQELATDDLDSSDGALADASGRVDALDALRDRVATDLTTLGALESAQRTAEADVGRHDHALTTLRGVRTPPGVAEVAGRLAMADAASAEARSDVAAAERAETAARVARAALPERAALTQLVDLHAEADGCRREHPQLEADAAEAAEEERRRAAALADARTVVEDVSRDQLEAADAERGGATALQESTARHRALAGLKGPGDVGALASAVSAATASANTASAVAHTARGAAADAEATVAALPDPVDIERARRAVADAAAAAQVLEDLIAGAASSAELAARLRADADRDCEHLASAEAAMAGARSRSLAADLRAHLAEGDDCPVCAQRVDALPEPLDFSELDGAAAAVDAMDVVTAEQARDTGVAASVAATAVIGTDAAGVEAVADRAAQARAAFDAARRAAAAAEDAERAARAELELARAAAATARRTLVTARDPLVALGAPPVDEDDPATGWAQLTTWAAGAAASVAIEVAAARQAAAAASAALQRADATLAAAHAEVERVEAAHAQAVRRHTAAAAALEHAVARLTAINARLASAPSAAEVDARLAEVDRFDEELAAAAEGLAAARAAADAAATERRAAEDAAVAARHALAAARDSLVRLGDPPALSDDLAGGWAALTAWATTATAAHVAARDEAAALAARSSASFQQVAGDLLASLLGVGLAVSDHHGAAAEIAVGRERAIAALDAIEKARSRRASATERIAAARAEAAVASRLGQLLRTDRFPRWLSRNALGVLAAAASETLLSLSEGQFELRLADDEAASFIVVDHFDADAVRSVKTLSGGETFQASLALALALASHLGHLAAEGAAQLEALFIDEGFGTLDEATLETVASTMETLAADRMVGVITHVTALADRVPVRYRVERNRTSSVVTRETA